jgi:nucleoside-diphosphate-sugar epimerase
MKDIKIVLPGGAGLVGQNLLTQLKKIGYSNVIVIDKHHENIKVLKNTFPEVEVIEADLAEKVEWVDAFQDADVVVMLQAQIGAKREEPFIRNNVTSTKNILDVMRGLEKTPYLIHISSSVLESVANDFYTNTKKEQEEIVLGSGVDNVVLRPTLMFGWFDRKHLGWLSRFMQKIPVFPIPGHGRYMRQPLYVKDFCEIIIACIERQPVGEVYNISGHEKINYIDIIREIKKAVKAKTIILSIPYSLFYVLLKIWGIFDSDPPFTTNQLEALVTPDEFETIDWPVLFGVKSTPFSQAIDETFNDPTYSHIKLKF